VEVDIDTYAATAAAAPAEPAAVEEPEVETTLPSIDEDKLYETK